MRHAVVTRWKGRKNLAAIVLVVAMGCQFGLNTGFTIFWVNMMIQHECTALTILANVPVPRPINPKKNPSRAQNYEFHEGIVYWKSSDGC